MTFRVSFMVLSLMAVLYAIDHVRKKPFMPELFGPSDGGIPKSGTVDLCPTRMKSIEIRVESPIENRAFYHSEGSLWFLDVANKPPSHVDTLFFEKWLASNCRTHVDAFIDKVPSGSEIRNYEFVYVDGTHQKIQLAKVSPTQESAVFWRGGWIKNTQLAEALTALNP